MMEVAREKEISGLSVSGIFSPGIAAAGQF